MSRRHIVVAVTVVAALGAYFYWVSDERQIRRLLGGVADAVTQHEGEGGVAGLADVASLARYLAPDATFEPGDPFGPINGAQEIVSTVGRLRAVMVRVELTFANAQIAVDGRTASVHTTARLALRDRNGDETVETRDALLALDKRDTGWVIATARANTP